MDLENIDEYLQDDINPIFIEVYQPFRLKCELNPSWIQNKDFIKSMILVQQDEIDGYDYYYEMAKCLKSKAWRRKNKDLSVILNGIMTMGCSNAFAETMGHIGNIRIPAHRKSTGPILFDALSMYPSPSVPTSRATYPTPPPIATPSVPTSRVASPTQCISELMDQLWQVLMLNVKWHLIFGGKLDILMLKLHLERKQNLFVWLKKLPNI